MSLDSQHCQISALALGTAPNCALEGDQCAVLAGPDRWRGNDMIARDVPYDQRAADSAQVTATEQISVAVLG